MAEKNVRVVKKASFGSFIFGFLFGIIFVVGGVVGLGIYAYKNISLKKVEETTGITIPVNDETKLKSLEQLIKTTSDLISEENLTLKKIEQTFGIVSGITDNSIPVAIKKSTSGSNIVFVYDEAQIDEHCLDISEFQTTPLAELSTKLSNFIQELSLIDLQKVADFQLPDVPLINNVKNLPLLEALNEVSSKMDFKNLTLADLNTEFGIDLSTVTALKDFMNVPLDGEGTNTLAYAIQNATIANFTGLAKQANETSEAYAYRIQQAGVLGAISGYKVTDLQTALNTITIGKLLGYEKQYVRSGTEGDYTYTLETDAEYNNRIKEAGLIGALKDATITNLPQAIEDLDLPNKKLKELDELGLIDLTSFEGDTTLIENTTLSAIIQAYLDAIN